MAAVKYQIKVVQGSKETFVETDDLEVLFKALGVDGIQLTKDGSGNLASSAPIVAPAGAGPTALVTKAELDAEIAARIADVDAEETRATTAEGEIAADLAQEITDREADVTAEETRATAAEGNLQAQITQEIADRTADVNAEETRATTAEGNLQTQITQEISDRTADVNAEETRALAAEANLQGQITQEVADRTADVNTEETRATAAEANLQSQITQEISDRQTGDNNLQAQITSNDADITSVQSQLTQVLANNPKEASITAVAAQVAFDFVASGIAWDADNDVRDVEVFVDGRRQDLDAWTKTSTTVVTFTVAPGAGRVVTVWKQGTSTNGGAGGGSPGNPINAVFLLDQGDLTTVWRLEVIDGELQINSVP